MPSYKLGRTTEDIRREVSAILRELKDPRVSGCMLSVVRVEVTNDLSYCTVYVSAMEGMETAENAVKGLKSAAGYVRRELGNRLKLRHVPEMIFKATDSIEYSANISRILHDLENEKKLASRKDSKKGVLLGVNSARKLGHAYGKSGGCRTFPARRRQNFDPQPPLAGRRYARLRFGAQPRTHRARQIGHVPLCRPRAAEIHISF